MNVIIALFILGILIALGTAFISMLKGGAQHSDKMLKSLQVRVGLSLLLFVFLLFASYMDWITPNQV